MQEKVSLYQINPLYQWPNNNFEQIETAVEDASSKGSTLCVLPEDFLFGLVRGKYNLRQAGSQFEHWSSKLATLATKHSIDLVPGSLPKLEEGSIYNTALYIDKDGKILEEYAKSNLWLTERGDITPSPYDPRVFNSVLGKTSLLICWDIMDPELFKRAVQQGAEWIIIPSFWVSRQSPQLRRERGIASSKGRALFIEGSMLDSLIATRSHENNVGIVFCNFGGTNTHIDIYGDKVKIPSAGRSQVIVPLGRVKARINNSRESTMEVEIDREQFITSLKDHEVLYGRHEDIKSTYSRSIAL